jgi:diguanylate cyclase (GGDEF)-like protein
LIWLVLACLLPGVIGATALFAYEYRERRTQLERDTLLTARALMQAVDSHLQRAQAVAETLSTSDALRRDDFAAFHARAREVMTLSALGTNVVVRDESGRQLLNTAVEFGTPLLAPPAPEQVRRTFATGSPTVADVFIGPVLKRPIMSVDVPVIIDGKVRYALGVGIMPKHFNAILKAQNLPSHWIAAILDSVGNFVARTHAAEETVGKQVPAEFLRRIRESDEGTMETLSRDGVPILSVYTRSPVTRWRVAIGIPIKSVDMSFTETLARLGTGVAAMFGIGLLLAWFAGGKIAHSVKALTIPASALGAGMPVPVPRVHIKEAAEVASAIERAGGLLQARNAELAEAHLLGKFGTWSWNLKTGEVTASESLPMICGREIPPFPEQKGTLLTEESWERVNAASMEAIETGKGYDLEVQINHGNGEILWMNAKCDVIRNEGGEISGLRGMILDITERKLAEQRVRDASMHDVLTGLPNRALVIEFCERLLGAAQRKHNRGALLFIDLDRFKPINDLHGHEAGDRVLQEVGKRLRACTRQEDLVGRLGGDEFVIVLPYLDIAHHRAATVAQHVIDEVSRPFRVDNLVLSISPSIGISYFPEHATDVSTLIHTADMAMYQAKQSGRATYQFYTPELDQHAEQALLLEMRLKNAINNGGLRLHYQPVVDVGNGRLVGAEALVRLNDSEDDPVGPDRFIPIAEATGMIGDLGEWVAAEACRQHGAWAKQGLELTIAINVSPLQFRQPKFADRLNGIIANAGIDPSQLVVEVTESAVMDNVDDAVEILNRIKSLGVKVALDDFGTGYSSLSSLSSLPLDKLKVDQSFVRRIERDKASRTVTEAIIALGHSLKLEVVGEGIESEDVLRYLRTHGCNQAQGFWFSQPLPPEEFAERYWEEWCKHNGCSSGVA